MADKFVTVEELNRLLSLQRDTILSCFRESVSTFMSTITTRVDTIVKDVQEIKTSLEFSNDVMDKKIATTEENLNKVKVELKATQHIQAQIHDKTSDLRRKTTDLEDRKPS